MKRRIGFLLILVLVDCSSACYMADNATDNALLAFARADTGIDQGSAAVETIYCPPCSTHPMSKDAALNLQYRFQAANKYEAAAYKIFKDALDTSNKFKLSAQNRAEIESQLLAIRGALSLEGVEGLSSNAAITLGPTLKPIEQAITALLKDLLKVKEIKTDISIQLTTEQRKTFDDLEAQIQWER